MDLMNLTAYCLLILTTGELDGLGEFVDGDIEISVPSDDPGEWP
jgi:hypothetical protein